MKRRHGGAFDPLTLDFSASINPLGPPGSVRSVLDRGMELVSKYPTPDAAELCQAIALHHGIPRECVLAANGASDLVYLLARLFQDERAEVVVPAFTEYEDACEAVGISVNEGRCTITFLGNPTNPEGRLLPREEILSRPGKLIVDEAFMDFTDGRESLLLQAAGDERIVV
ncbi:MAG: aminotransferase class I/II-fold pyridoxal phosphate-dependent enzyme, partial [bacterium]